MKGRREKSRSIARTARGWPAFRMEVQFGIRTVFQNVLILLNFRIYLYFLAMVSVTQVGWYSVALLFCEAVRFVPNAVSTALYPFLNSGTHEDAGRIAAKSCRYLLTIGLLVAVVFSICSGLLLRHVFGAQFAPATFATVMMTWGAAIGIVYQSMTAYFTSIGSQKYCIRAAGGGLVMGLIAGALLIPNYGINGAGIAYMISSTTSALISGIQFMLVSQRHPREFLIISRDDARTLLRFASSRIAAFQNR